jgi:hypothetical protein
MKLCCAYRIGGMLLVTAMSFAGTKNESHRDVQILQSDETGITIEYRPEYFRPRTFNVGSQAYVDFTFYGGVSVEIERTGVPNLRHRPLAVALPSTKGNSVEVIGTEYEDVRGAVVVPVPKLVEDEAGFGTDRFYEQNVSAYGSNRFEPPSIIEFSVLGYSRSTLIGQIKVYPVQYNAAAGIVRRHTKIIIRVNFGFVPRLLSKPIDDFPMSSDILNGEAARLWTGGLPLVPTGIINSVLAGGEWYRIEVKEDGIFRLGQSALSAAGINVSQIDPRTIKIYGNGGRELPQDVSRSRPIDLVENAILVSGEGDGRFDSGDFILFYGKGVRGWEYIPTRKVFSHYIHHYTDANYYWLTFGGTQGKRMASLPSLSETTVYSPTKFTAKLFVEEEKYKTKVTSGLDWFGQFFDSKNNLAVIQNKLDGLVTSDPIRYNFVFMSRSASFTAFRVEDAGASLGTVVIPPTDVGSIVYYYGLKSDVTSFQRSGNLPDSRSVVRITYDATSSTAEGYLDWMEIFYSHDYLAVNDVLNFTSPDTATVVQYDLGNFSASGINVFDVTDASNTKVISGAQISGGSLRFQARQQSGSVSEYFAVGPQGYKSPVAIQRMGNSNLHGFAEGATFVIITHSDFLSQAQRLKAHREQPGPDRLGTVVVNVQDIYNEFAGGLLDPTAIRDYLKYAYENWTIKPRYVLLFGDGDVDYKNVIAQDKNWIPPYETPETLYQINTYCTDDYYAQIVGNDPIIDLAIGRLTVRTADAARVVVDKIIGYESSTTFDPWKNRITYVADDGLTSTGDDGPIHTAQAEDLAERFTPNDFEKVKIYLVEYPTVQSASGRRKPDAAKAIVNEINAGTLIINWTGHGNPEVWAHEHVFERETTIPQLVNKDRLPFVGAATCDFARYDDPQAQSAAELLLVRENGGSIATLSSARAVYSFDNAEFNNIFFSRLLVRDTEGRLTRLGDALFLTKQTHYSVNDTKFGLIGDPTLRLSVPKYRAEIDSINGFPPSSGTQLKALSNVSIQGSVRKLDGTLWNEFNGTLLMTVFDSRREKRIPEWFGFPIVLPGGVIYRGENTISNGRFTATFFVPKDISYENNRGRVTVYFSGASNDGSGYTENVLIGGTDTLAVSDLQGPDVSIYLDSRAFRSGDIVGDNPLLIIDYFDEHGINLAASGIGHRLEARIDDQTRPIDLTNFYKGKVDSYKEGSVEYPLSGLADGKHRVTAKAWDVYNNSTVAEAIFEVATSSTLRVSNVVNYPNPFARTTTFTFQQNQAVPIDVEIKVYTLAGRVVRVLRSPGISDRFVQLNWDGRDEDGDELANGVYIYKVIARTVDGASATEALGKLSVLK